MVEAVHPATAYQEAYLECVRIVSAGSKHAQAAACTVRSDQIRDHLIASELTQF